MARKGPEVRYITGGRKDPLLIRVLEAENPEFKNNIHSFLQSGQQISLEKARRSPNSLIEAFDKVKTAVSHKKGREGDIPLLTAKALVRHGSLAQGTAPSETLQTDIAAVEQQLSQYTRLVTSGSGNKDALSQINTALQKDPTVQKYAIHRLTWDIPEGEKSQLARTFLVGAGADLVGFGLEFGVAGKLANVIPGWVRQGAEGAGLFVTGQSDDAVSAIGTFKTERGGTKTNRQIFKENKLTFGMMGAAGLTDLLILPPAFQHNAILGIPNIGFNLPIVGNHIEIPGFNIHTPMESVTHNNWYWPLFTGLTFAFTAYAGSLTGKLSNINRSRSTIKTLDKEGMLPGREGRANTLKFGQAAWMGLMENQSHSFRLGLLAGIGLSTTAALIASFTGVLEGNVWSSTIQAGIGPLETISAFAAAWGLAEAGYSVYKKTGDTRELRRRLRKAPGKPLNL